MNDEKLPEPWLRGTLTDIPPVLRAVLHALELAKQDIDRWCAPLTDAQLNARPAGIAPVAFHLRHIARSLDRLLTYAEGNQLTEDQLSSLRAELDSGRHQIGIIRGISGRPRPQLDEPRAVGKRRLPSTVAGLLVHVADHTQRHVGQAITTAKIVTQNSQSIS